MSKTILVPLDGSELAEQALPWAEVLAKKYEEKVELMRCYEPLASIYMLPEFAAPAPVFYDQSAFYKQIDEYLNKRLESLPVGSAIKTRAEGDPASVILDRAESGEVSTVVMASHGRGGLGRWLLGSVATKVVRGSTIPTLIINAKTEVKNTPEVRRILVPLDGSDTAEAALPQALKLAEAFGATIRLYQGVAHTPIGHPHLDKAVSLELQNAREYLEKVKVKYPDVTMSSEVKVAGPNLGIAEEAKNADLVVMSSHGRSGFKRWLLGSVAENVLQSVDKPLMIVYRGD